MAHWTRISISVKEPLTLSLGKFGAYFVDFLSSIKDPRPDCRFKMSVTKRQSPNATRHASVLPAKLPPCSECGGSLISLASRRLSGRRGHRVE